MVEKSHTTGFWPGLVDPFRNLAERVSEWIAPASEASGVEDGYKIALELPGVAEPDIHISASDGVVTVKGEKKTAREEQGESWFFSERQYGAFSRSFRLPPDADAGKVEAHLKDGVLTIRVPRKAPKQAEAAARIPIRTG
jgi:Molecular chaperone (small heat shock protein)